MTNLIYLNSILLILLNMILPFYIAMLIYLMKPHHTSYCVQPPNAGVLPNFQHPTFIEKYGEQRIYIQGLTSDNYFFSYLVMVTSPSIIMNRPLQEWKCNNTRTVVHNVVYYNSSLEKYETIQDIGYITKKQGEPVFSINNSLFTNHWKINWETDMNTNISVFTVHNEKIDINLKIDNIMLVPQGPDNNDSGYVPNDNSSNALSFNSPFSRMEGNIGDIYVDKLSTSLYLESVTATENINMFNLACVYILESNQKQDIMFVCGTLNGEYSKYSRGMIMYKNGGRKWLESNDFTIKPFGKQYYSNYTNTSFYREYRVRINNITEFTVFPLPNQTNIDFGLKSGKLVQWTQEVVLKNLTGVRGILELVKS